MKSLKTFRVISLRLASAGLLAYGSLMPIVVSAAGDPTGHWSGLSPAERRQLRGPLMQQLWWRVSTSQRTPAPTAASH